MSESASQDVPHSESALQSPPPGAESARFPSFAALRRVHGTLLDRHDAGLEEDGRAFWREIALFIEQARSTGALLDDRSERRATYSIINFWSSKLYEAGFVSPEVRLLPFDETLAPSLDDVAPPYVGLEAFSEQTHDRFFGRQALVEETLGKLQRLRLVAVVGQSGSGKSSLVLGGVLPALKGGGLRGSEAWHYLPRMVPGSEPLTNLAALFRPVDLVDEAAWLTSQKWRFIQDDAHLLTLLDRQTDDEPAVLVIDQFEELFTLCDDAEERQAFTDNLLHLVQNEDAKHYAIITMRSDYRSNVARLPNFNERFRAGTVNMEALDIPQLRAVIEGPAEQVGLKFEVGVVDDLIEDVLGEPAALPLLQFTLWRLWEERNRNRITREAYDRLGGAKRALETCADQFIEGLSPEWREAAKHILLQMVYLNRNLEVTSRRVRRADLYHEGGADVRIDDVLQALVKERLVRLTPGGTANNPCAEDDQIEVAHEALIRNWPLLRDWMAADFDRMRQRNNLTHQAQQWAHARTTEGRDETGLLWGEAALEEARTYGDLTEEEEAFLRASGEAVARRKQQEKEAADRERLAEKRQREAQQQSVRRLTALAGILLVVLAAAVFFAFSAVSNEREAEENLATATRALADAERARQQAGYNLDIAQNNLESAVTAQALAASRLADANAARATAQAAATIASENESLAEAARLANMALQSARAFSPGSGKPILLSIEALKELPTSADARRAYLDAVPQEIHYTRVVTPLNDAYVQGWPIILSRDARLAAAANVETGQDVDFVVWDTATGETSWQFPRPASQYVGTMEIGNGNSLLATSGDVYLNAWNLTEDGADQVLEAQFAQGVTAIAVSPVEPVVAAAAGGGQVTTWSLGGPQIVSRTLPLTNLGTFDEALPMTATTDLQSFGMSTVLAFSQDGETLAIGNIEGKVVLWDVQVGRALPVSLLEHPAPVIALHFSEDGRRLVTGDSAGALRLFDLSEDEPEPTLLQEGVAGDMLLAFSPDGQRLATSDGFYDIVLWDLSGDEPDRARLFERRDQAALAFAADGDGLMVAGQLLASDASAGVRLAAARWDIVHPLSVRRDLGSHTRSARTLALAFPSTGERPLLATGGCAGLSDKEESERCDLGEILLWDVAARSPLQRTLHGHRGAVTTAALNSASDVLAAAGSDGGILVWQGLQSSIVSSRTLAVGVSISSTVFSPDGRDLIAGSADGLSVWRDVVGANPVRRTLTSGTTVGSLAVSADERWLAAGDVQGQVSLWPLPALDEPVVQPVQHRGPVSALAFHPQHSLLASGSEDGTVIVRFLCGEAPTVAEGTSSVTGLTFSPDGTMLVAGTAGGQVVLWQVEVDAGRCESELQRLGTLSQDGSPLQSAPLPVAANTGGADLSLAVVGVGFVPGSAPRLVVAYGSGDVQLWELDTAVWIDIGCEIAGRNLTLSEWEEAFPTRDFLDDYAKTCDGPPVHSTVIQQAIDRAELEHDLENSIAAGRAYEQAARWASESDDAALQLSLCISGALHEAVGIVAQSCQRAVTLDPVDGRTWDAQGLAQALQGEPQAAAESFQRFVAWTLADPIRSVLWRPQRELREAWIDQLAEGEAPFVDETTLAIFQPATTEEMSQRLNEARALAEADREAEATNMYADLARWASSAPEASDIGRGDTQNTLLWLNGMTCAYGERDGAGNAVTASCERAAELATAFPDSIQTLISVCREESWARVETSSPPICGVVADLVPEAGDSAVLVGACQDALYGQLPDLAAVVCPEAVARVQAGEDEDPAQIDALAQAASYACQNARPEAASFSCELAVELLSQSGFELAEQYYGICRGGVVNGLADAVMDACERATALEPGNSSYEIVLAFAQTRQLAARGELEEAGAAYEQLAQDALASDDSSLQFDICVAGLGDGYVDAVLAACGELRSIAYEEEASGNLRTNERHFWHFPGRAGDRIIINLEQDTGSGLDPYLTLLDTHGNVLAIDDDGGDGLNSRIMQELPVDGVYWIIARGFGTSSGRYRLEVQRE